MLVDPSCAPHVHYTTGSITTTKRVRICLGKKKKVRNDSALKKYVFKEICESNQQVVVLSQQDSKQFVCVQAIAMGFSAQRLAKCKTFEWNQEIVQVRQNIDLLINLYIVRIYSTTGVLSYVPHHKLNWTGLASPPRPLKFSDNSPYSGDFYAHALMPHT